MSKKQGGRSRIGTRPFMPLHGKKTVPHRGGVEHKSETIMQVGAEAMIDDVSTQTDEQRLRQALGGTGAATNPQASAAPDARGGEGQTLEQIKAERDSYLDMARRERADFDNYRKRVEREKGLLKRESLGSFLREFFGPLEDMDRVLAESEKEHSAESLVTGVRIMQENFWRVLAKAGVKRIEAQGKPFDPNLHEAMTTIPSVDVPPNTVVEVFERGYKLDDVVLRPAKVVVSRAVDA